jgi:O-antigen ligase
MLALIALPLVLNLFVLYNSRGALVGLGFAALAAVVIVHWQARVRIAAAGVAAALLLFNLADPRFIARQQSTATATDNSALSRLESWKGGARLVLDHPFGTGGRGFHQLSPIYIPDIVEGHRGELRSVHNLYLQTASEWGLQGISFFLMFILCSIYMLHRLRRQSSTADPWYYRSVAIEVGLLGTLVAGIFSDRLYGESIYWMAALSFAAYRIHATTAPAEQPAAPAPVPADVRREPSYSMPRPNLPATTIRERLSRSLDY